MSKLFLVFSFLFFVVILSVSSLSFTFEDKEINLIDFPGFHRGSINEAVFDLASNMDFKDVLVGDTSSSEEYIENIMVAINSNNMWEHNLSDDEFKYIKASIKDEFNKNGIEYGVDDINSYVSSFDLSISDFAYPRIVIDQDDRLCFSNATQIEGIDDCILSLTGMILVKGKIVWVYYHTPYSTVVEYENAVSLFNRYLDLFIDANGEESLESISIRINSLLKGSTDRYYSRNKSNSCGVDYSIDIPTEMKEKDTDKEHIVHSFAVSLLDGVTLSTMVSVDNGISSMIGLLGDNPRISDISDNPSDIVPDRMKEISSGVTSVGVGIEAYYCEAFYSQKIGIDQEIDVLFYILEFVQDKSLVCIQFSVGGDSSNDIKAIYEMALPLFYRITGSYKVQNETTRLGESSIENEIINLIKPYIITAYYLPFIGMVLLGIIIRFGIVHHAMKKEKALISSVSLGGIIVILMFIIAGDFGSLIGGLGAAVFFAIVRIGHSEYDTEQEQLRTELEEIRKNRAIAEQEAKEAEKARKEAELAKKEAKEKEQRADEIRRESEEAVHRLETELEKVKERNRRLEKEAKEKRTAAQGSTIVKDKCYYMEVLGVSEGFTSSDLRKAYHEKVTLYHPDKVNSLGEKLKIVAEEEMKNINDAYSFLSRFSK